MVAMQLLFGIMPISMYAMLALAAWLVRLAILVAVVYGAYMAWNGKQWTIPVVTNIGQKSH
jgi:uncharacterized membrane protein